MTLKEAALYYASLGLSVFPLYPKSKKPAIKNGFKGATKDLTTIKLWWGENPDFNIGIATGEASGGGVGGYRLRYRQRQRNRRVSPIL